MTNEDIKHNFHLCIKWLKDNVNKIGNKTLFIGWGDKDYSRPWTEKEFHNYDHNIELYKNACDGDLDVSINVLGGYYVEVFGYEKDVIEKWEKSYKGTGMRCPRNHNTFDDLSIVGMEQFLLQWKRIKDEVLERIAETEKLDNFEV